MPIRFKMFRHLMRMSFKKPNILIFGPLVWDHFRSPRKSSSGTVGRDAVQWRRSCGRLGDPSPRLPVCLRWSRSWCPNRKVDANPYEHVGHGHRLYLGEKSAAALYRLPGALSPRSVSFATRFYTTPMTVLSEYVQSRRSERLQAFYDEDLKVVAADLGAMIAQAIP